MKRILKETSFICTVYNERQSIVRFLESLKEQTVLPGEIVIVDGGSSDGTFSLMEDFFSKWAAGKDSQVYIHNMKSDEDSRGKVAVKLLQKKGAGISEGRNIAINNASGTYINVSDAGCVLDPHWLIEINRGMEKDIGAVNGGITFSLCGNFLQSLTALAVVPGLNEIVKEKFMPSSRNICFRKSQWDKAGGYPQELDFGEDMKFDFNLKKCGYRLVFRPDAAVYWDMRRTLPGIFRQFFRYAKGDAVGKMYPVRHLLRFGAAFLFLLITAAGIWLSPWLFMILIPLGGIYSFRQYFRLLVRWDGNESCRLKGMAGLSALLLLPLLLVYIDSAKAVGYIYGLCIK